MVVVIDRTPCWEIIYAYLAPWARDGTLPALQDAQRDQVRVSDRREASAIGRVVDAQSVKGADTVGAATRGFDARKRTSSPKRHIAIDTTGCCSW
jgi:hypothetical protein